MLTSVGLALTFIAILIGLAHIHPDETGRLAWVEELVYNLSGKFISSITALILAVIFTWFDKAHSQKLHKSFQGFIDTLNKRFSRMPAECLLDKLAGSTDEQVNAIKGIATDLADPVMRGVEQGMGPLVEKLSTAIEELKRQKQESFSSSFADMIEEFRSALFSSTGSQFEGLADSIQKSSELIASMTEAQSNAQQKTEQLMTNLDAFLTRQQEVADQHL